MEDTPRPRRQEEDGEPEGASHDGKRRKVERSSTSAATGGRAESAESDDEGEELMHRMKEQGLDGDETEEDESEPGALRVRREVSSSGARSSDAGVILEIRMQHFMCHEHLKISLNRRTNFISGSNGSGKSAILAALQACLGARAKFTHRANKLSDLIQRGYGGDAIVEVKLFNTEDGYQYDQYGTSITVRRTIRSKGAGKLELVNDSGVVVSKLKKDLEQMLDHLNIQVENPCAVLDQENAKKFLKGNEKDKYQFFMKATDLERILRDAEATTMKIDSIMEAAVTIEGRLEHSKRRTDDLERQMRAFQELRDIEDAILLLKKRGAWAELDEVEEYESHARGVVELEEKYASEFQTRATDFQDKAQALRADLVSLRARMESKMLESNEAKKEAEEARVRQHDAEQPIRILKASAAGASQELRTKKVEKRELEDRFRTMEQEMMRRASGCEEKQAAAERDQAQANLEHARQQRPQLEERLQELESRIAPLQASARDSRLSLDRCSADLQAEKQRFEGLTANIGNPLAVYGGNVIQLVKRIEQAKAQGRFAADVCGPVGVHVTVKPEFQRYKIMAEFYMRGFAQCYVVSSARDKTVLQQVFNEGGWRSHPMIIVQPPHERYQPQRLPQGYITLADCLQIEHDTVYNALLDQAKLERVVCFDSRNEAEGTLFRGQRSGAFKTPYNIKESAYLNADSKQFNILSTKNGNANTRANVLHQGQQLLRVSGASAADQQAQLQQTITTLEHQLRELRVAYDGARNDEANATRELQQLNNRVRELEQIERREGARVEQLQRKLDDLLSNGAAIDTSGVQAEIGTVNDEIAALSQNLEAWNHEIREKAGGIVPFKEAVHKADKRREALAAEMDRLGNEYQEVQAQKQHAEAKAQKAEEKMEVHRAKLLEAKNAFQEAAARSKEKDAQVRHVLAALDPTWDGSRMRAEDTREQIAKKIKAKQELFERQRMQKKLDSKSRTEVEREYKLAKLEYRTKRRELNELRATAERLREENGERVKKWHHFRKYIAIKTRSDFDKHMQRRGSSGDVNFDMKNKSLSLTVQRLNTDEGTQTNNVKQLSGGERSHTTLALLMALGGCHECPFRVMDEFDVYMDSISRGTAILMLLEYARAQPQRQFIFITPNPLNNVVVGKDVVIHRMAEARPIDQRTLDSYLPK